MTLESSRPELSRTVPLDRIGATGLDFDVQATASECTAIAARLDVPAVAAFACRFVLAPVRAGVVLAEARLQARLTRICVVSLDPFEVTLDDSFSLRFVPDDRLDPDPDPDSVDEIPYIANRLDLGEAAVEQLALTLDPYPRAPGTELPPDIDPAAASPFAALRGRAWDQGK